MLPPTTEERLQRWSARVGTIDDMQTHQPDTTTVCPLLEALGNADTTAMRILELYDLVHAASSSSVVVDRKTPHGRSANVKKDCRNRDGNRSVLSQFMEEGLQVAHIIPYSASGGKVDMFWPFIGMFLKKDEVTALMGLVLEPQGTTDHLRNVMLLSSTEHRAFDTHKWELVPVLEMLPYNPNTCSEYKARVGLLGKKLISLSSYIQTSAGTEHNGNITDGHLVTLMTPNPAKLPLPHPLLLQLHSICPGIISLRASAGYPLTATASDERDGKTACHHLEDHAPVEGGPLESLQRKLVGVPQVLKTELVEAWRGSVCPSEGEGPAPEQELAEHPGP
ncbi:hypothetical protein DFP73DRAFT_599076 [Morchella snyderi]|nr:hypothetical protein DFP73DRAFT_599076 [Morchella snyderi]